MKFKDYITEEFVDVKTNIKETMAEIDPNIKKTSATIVRNFGGVKQDEPGIYKNLRKAIENWMKKEFK